MCGIVGAVADRNVVPILIEGLKRLEYRGYDSAGVAVVGPKSQIGRVRTAGKVASLEGLLNETPLDGSLGIAHTRWATHGEPTQSNAHPHVSSGRVAVVHNGIIENHGVLREEQIKLGYKFTSETDTEVVVHQVHRYLAGGAAMLDAVRHAVADLDGAYALGVVSCDEPTHMVAARRGSPLVIGLGDREQYLASDVSALISVTNKFIFLEDGDVAELTRDGVKVVDADGIPVSREVSTSTLSAHAVDKGHYRHFMLKEIYEQPGALADTLEGRLHGGRVLEQSFGPGAAKIFDSVKAVQIVACGTSYHSGLVARHWFEGIAGIPCSVEVASEFRYREPVIADGTLVVTISQSGETADTLAALRGAKDRGFGPTLGIINVPESSLVRESDLVLMTRAGPEIGVASTKAFTTQLVALMLLVVVLGRRHALTPEHEAKLVAELESLPATCRQALQLNADIKRWSEDYADKHHALFLGRGPHYPVAMEGALKLKEISYIHAEAYPAGELKHGPLALVDAEMPVVVVAPNDKLLEKLKSNMQEVRARGGRLYVLADAAAELPSNDGTFVMNVPHSGDAIAPIVFTIPLQLLAYHVAVLKGTDVDQPRNLAKSVTVE